MITAEWFTGDKKLSDEYLEAGIPHVSMVRQGDLGVPCREDKRKE